LVGAGVALAGVAAAALAIVVRTRFGASQQSSLVQSISPRARVLAVVGDPVDVTRTPLIFPTALARSLQDRDAVLVPLHVPPSGLRLAFDALRLWGNFDGFVLTKPHKEAAIALVDELTPDARSVGAINVARIRDGRVIGHILDGIGFTDGLTSAGHAVQGRRFLLIGAGGAARAIAFTLHARGASSIDVINRTASRARALVSALAAQEGRTCAGKRCHTAALSALPPGLLHAHYDVVVQCTNQGHHPDDQAPIDLDRLVPPLVCAEVIHTPLETRFLAVARRQGCTVHHGAHMLDKQIDAICTFLTM